MTDPLTLPPAGKWPRGIFAFAAGNYATDPTKTIASIKAGPFPGVHGIEWVLPWKDLEPSQGAYDWKLLDACIAASEAAGLRCQVAVIPGFAEPAWVVAACPTVTVKMYVTGQIVKMAVPTSTEFASAWFPFVAALGAHLAGKSGVVSVQMTGGGDQGEMVLSAPQGTTWSAVGVTTKTLIAFWEANIAAWCKAVPPTS